MSEFGKGLAYCLGLFIGHEFQWKEHNLGTLRRTWFNGSSDHLFELNIDEAPEKMRARLEKLRTFALEHRLLDCTEEDINHALTEAKELLMMVDAELGVTTEKGDWE